MFDILTSMGAVRDAVVLDLFCGSGALGLEALSRGARAATFVDNDSDAIAAVRTNLRATGLGGDAATVVRAELPGWLARASHADLAFCDPPYSFEGWGELLSLLDADVALLESGDPVAPPEGWMVARERRYGGTLVTVVHKSDAPGRPAPRGAAGR
jgi:16S rRNA (guanine966-N2)-methyltransferase